ncbi:MAG: hypothetical protein QOJ29_362 [Thermoleophilaceae bacterium]|nr:hypothetical protein [Thermoleophilaceae bacterium]
MFPLLSVGVCLGIGLLVERAAGTEWQPALLPPLGFAAAIAVAAPVFATGTGALPVLVLLVVLALAGFALGATRLAALRPGAGALVGSAVYALHLAPVALSGQVSFLGYNLLNDTAIHLALVDWIGAHGSHFIHQPPGSFGATVNDYVATRYPLASHELLAALKPLVGLDSARIYQPFLALCAALTASALYALLRAERAPRVAAAVSAGAALAGQLGFSFALQGGIKELSFLTCLAVAAALGGSGALVVMALPAAALYGIYGVYALPWIAPLAVVAVVLLRPRPRTLVVAVGLFLVAIAYYVPGSIDYYRHGHDVITSGEELGPLAGPLKPLQAAGVWLGGDYRFTPSWNSWLTYLLDFAVVVGALAGLLLAFRRGQRGLLLLAIPCLVAYVGTAPMSSPYIDAKLLMLLSPALLLAAAVALGALTRRRLALAAATALALALLVSDGLAYRVALVAPIDRLDELAQIDRRFAGHGPILVNEFEEYTKHFMRRSPGSDPYEKWTAARAELVNPKLHVAGHAFDLDQMRGSYVQRWRLIALRRSPVASRPPSNYGRVWRGEFYEVWKRSAAAPQAHLGLGKPPLDPTQPFLCKRGDQFGGLIVAARPKPLIVGIREVSLPPGWYRDAQNIHALDVRKGGRIETTFEGHGPVRVWLRGRAFRKMAVLIDGRRIGTARGLNGPNQWIEIGNADLSAGTHRIALERPKRSLRPGDAQTDVIGPIAIESRVEPKLIRGGALRNVCGQSADWLDVSG